MASDHQCLLPQLLVSASGVSYATQPVPSGFPMNRPRLVRTIDVIGRAIKWQAYRGRLIIRPSRVYLRLLRAEHVGRFHQSGPPTFFALVHTTRRHYGQNGPDLHLAGVVAPGGQHLIELLLRPTATGLRTRCGPARKASRRASSSSLDEPAKHLRESLMSRQAPLGRDDLELVVVAFVGARPRSSPAASNRLSASWVIGPFSAPPHFDRAAASRSRRSSSLRLRISVLWPRRAGLDSPISPAMASRIGA